MPGVACNRYHLGEREGKMTVLGIFHIVAFLHFFQVLAEATLEDGMLLAVTSSLT